jgi:translation initiation factor 2 gamma subunit (eIF-2gamma)
VHVIATAGHVDHGKSTLVRALTGIEPDRWAEERRRGMTIDLGYAWTTLASGADVAFVDVPGHQRFIGNMLAGLGPAPAVMLVVAADEGWRPQSAEHLAAVDALGISRGLVVVTRSDLADPGPAMAEALDHVGRTSLAGSAALAVSARTGEGLDALRGALDDLVGALLRKRDRPAGQRQPRRPSATDASLDGDDLARHGGGQPLGAGLQPVEVDVEVGGDRRHRSAQGRLEGGQGQLVDAQGPREGVAPQPLYGGGLA